MSPSLFVLRLPLIISVLHYIDLLILLILFHNIALGLPVEQVFRLFRIIFELVYEIKEQFDLFLPFLMFFQDDQRPDGPDDRRPGFTCFPPFTLNINTDDKFQGKHDKFQDKILLSEITVLESDTTWLLWLAMLNFNILHLCAMFHQSELHRPGAAYGLLNLVCLYDS